MTTAAVKSRVHDRLLTPPRLERFCPRKHCARPCGPDDCTCKPCRCEDCRAPANPGRRDPLGEFPAPNRQPRLFTERTFAP